MTDTTPDFETAIAACVRRFYDLARADDLLAPVFNGAITDWDKHLETMDNFWASALLGVERYRSAPFPPHLNLRMGQEHFDRWLAVWSPVVRETLPEPIRSKALTMSEHMAHCWGRAYVAMASQAVEA